MGGKKKNNSKKKKTKVQLAAQKRHETFKKTGVQTFGGTKKKYSKKEAEKIEKAMGPGSFSKVTGGAANPLNRAPDNRGVEAGELTQPVKDFNTFLGNDYSMFAGPSINYNYSERPESDISFSDAVRSGARFNEAALGRNEINQNIASHDKPLFKSVPARLDQPASKEFIDGMLQRNIIPSSPNNVYGVKLASEKINPFNIFQTQDALKEGEAAREGKRDTIENPGFFDRILNRNTETQKMIDMSSTGIGDYSNLIAAADPTALSGLGIGAPKTTGYTPTIGGLAESLGLDPKTGQDVSTTAGGLNIGGNFGLSAEESDRLGRVFNAPTNNRMLSEGGDLRMSDMFEADTQGAKISKGINTIKNNIPLLNRLPDLKINTVAEEAQRRYLGYNPNLPASALARMDRRGGGGTRLPMTPTVAQEVAPQYQPVPSASTTPTTQTGVDPNRLLQIQQQAYAQAYNPMTIGGFNPQFRFGAATPTIDYSTYFNY